MRTAFAAAVVAVALLGCATGAEETPSSEPDGAATSVDGFCEFGDCRRSLRVRLKQAGQGYFDRTYWNLPPAVQPTFISIYAGETLYIEAQEGAERPEKLRHVKEKRHPERTIEIELTQEPEISDGLGMILEVRNPFSRPLRYNLSIMPLDREEMYRTTSCPLTPGGFGMEIWPFPIFVIAIANMRFLGPEGPFRCEY